MGLQLRFARTTDAERLVQVINAAFRKAESYIMDGDRVDLELIQSLLAKGEFLIAEDVAGMAGCVYLEHRGGPDILRAAVRCSGASEDWYRFDSYTPGGTRLCGSRMLLYGSQDHRSAEGQSRILQTPRLCRNGN